MPENLEINSYGDPRIRFSSGRTLDANRGIIGLSPDLAVYEGYDGSVCTIEDVEEGSGFTEFTPDDMCELADLMIARWTQFKEKLVK